MDVRRSSVAVAVAALLCACTFPGGAGPAASSPPPPAPSPSPLAAPSAAETTRAVVVVGPTPAAPVGERAAWVAAARELARVVQRVDEVRVVEADTLAFAEELGRLFVDDGADLVCIVGAETGPRVARLAQERPGAVLCGTDAPATPPPDNLAVVALDMTDVARLTGSAVGPVARTVVLVTRRGGDADEPLLEALARGLPERLPPAPRPPRPNGRPRPTPDLGPAVVGRRVAGAAELAAPPLRRELLQRPAATVTLTGLVDREVAQLARSEGVPVVGLADWLVERPGGPLPGGVLAGIEVDRTALLAAAAQAALEGQGGVRRVGLAEGVLGVTPGPARGSQAAAQRVADVLGDQPT